MRFLLLAMIVLGAAGCAADPVASQAARDLRHTPERADTMLALESRFGAGPLDGGQLGALRVMAAAGRRAQRDEFVVVSDGSGGPIQQARAQQARQALRDAGARWVEVALQPSMETGPDAIVVVRSEYRIGQRNCPDFSRPNNSNVNEAVNPSLGCSDAYNFGQMLARPRDAAIGRDPGMADATVNADAVQRYREGRVRAVQPAGTSGAGGGGAATGGAAPAGGGATTTPTN